MAVRPAGTEDNEASARKHQRRVPARSTRSSPWSDRPRDPSLAMTGSLRPFPFLTIAGACVLAACGTSRQITPSDAATVLAHQALAAPNPARPGPRAVRTLYYGSGTDRRRPVYRDSVRIRTGSVDASKLIDLGDQADERNGYWGFSPNAFPLNGRVWYPEGPGPFPIVLIVHGNHNPRDFSDPGYRYLGEHLASHGFIAVSVDMNFVNGGIREENDARGWLLLQHLRAWRAFHEGDSTPFSGRVDLGRAALIGHSRGGEAVGHAAAFNTLAYYPDDASLAFDFGFGIQSIIAIAPVDGQYLPTGRFVPVENVNYLVFHGSHDGDVTSFHGLRQYQRVRFTDGVSRFKAAVYVYRANHGQWNTVWGSHDNGPRSGRILDLSTLIDADDQREFGLLYVTAFLRATLQNDERYLPMFRDHRVVGEWLPKTMYVTRFQSSGFHPLATFEEDIDVTTGTEHGVTTSGDSLATWREDRLDLRSRNRTTTSGSQGNQAAWLGWNRRVRGQDSTRLGAPAAYQLDVPASLVSGWGVDSEWTLDFLLAATNATPPPRAPPGADSSQSAGRRDASSREPRVDDEDRPPIDLSIELIDGNGTVARVLASRYGPIRRPLEIRILRRGDLERRRFADSYDLVLQGFSIPLGDFAADAAALDLHAVRRIRFVFDRTPAGTVVLDDIGLTDLPAAFTRARIATR